MRLSLPEIRDLSERLARGGSFGGANAVQIETRILAGQEIGVGPITAATNITVANGKIMISASLQAALVLQSDWYVYEVVEVTDERAEIRFHDNGAGEALGTSVYTIAEAARAGLTKKQVWQQYPADMVFNRALTRGVRRYCPDILVGNPAYTREELGEDVREVVVESLPLPTPPAKPGITDKQIAEIRDAVLELKIPADKWMSILAKRGVKQTRDLTEAQAAEILQKFNHLVATKQLEDGMTNGKAVAPADSRLVMDIAVSAKKNKKEVEPGADGAEAKSSAS
jgi:hypothetical protein